MNYLYKLDKWAKIRIVSFGCLMIWCIYLSAGYSWEIIRRPPLFSGLLGDSGTTDFYVDGTDFSVMVTLLGYAAKGLLTFFDVLLYMFLLLVYTAISAVLVAIPMFILIFVGLKNKTTTLGEYNLTKYIYFTAIALSIITGLIAAKLTGVVIILYYTAVWALLVLIYVFAVKKRIENL